MINRKPRNCLSVSNLSGSARNTSDWLGKHRHTYDVSDIEDTYMFFFIRLQMSLCNLRRVLLFIYAEVLPTFNREISTLILSVPEAIAEVTRVMLYCWSRS